MGVCPPSKAGPLPAPERAPCPFWPRPDVLPEPEPIPRPTRRRALRLPGAGFSSCSLMTPRYPQQNKNSRLRLFHVHQVLDLAEHSPDARVVFLHHGLIQPPKAERPQGLLLVLGEADGAPLPRHLDLSHREKPPSRGSPQASSPAGGRLPPRS